MSKLPKFYQTIDMGFRAINFGRAKMEVAVHNGEPVYFISDDFSTQRYKENGTVEATKLFLEEYRKAVEKRQSGTFTFTVTLKSGNTKTSHLQKNYKIYI